MAKHTQTRQERIARKQTRVNHIKSVAWLIEATFRGFVGWVMLSNFDHIVTTAAGIYALATAAVIVTVHFVKANKA